MTMIVFFPGRYTDLEGWMKEEGGGEYLIAVARDTWLFADEGIRGIQQSCRVSICLTYHTAG